MKKVMVVLGIIGLLGVIGTTGKIAMDEHLYNRELDKVEMAVSEFNDRNEESTGAYCEASYAEDWKTESYCISVNTYTVDGSLCCTEYYGDVDEFIKGEF